MTDEKKLERERLISENLGLVHACAGRFRGKGTEYDDLFQAGCVGLVKAADKFDKSRGFAFSTYAVPVILGEIKRIFRDGGILKVGRAMKERGRETLLVKDEFLKRNGREPTVAQLAELLGITPAETAQILGAVLPPLSLTRDSDEGQGEQTDIAVPSAEENTSDLLALSQVLYGLSGQERQIIEYRYFQNLTQTQTAQKLGVSQVQVSRKEKKILLRLREQLVS
jgi:RNA polymerase sporulation-specific sigma factor